jgi:acetoin utilization deacetylase AcuC-like enzyme
MTILYSSALFQEHQTGSHPETPRRLSSIDACLTNTGRIEQCRRGLITAPDLSWLRHVHTPDQIGLARQIAESGGGHLDPDTVISNRSYEVALQACGTACSAVEQLLTNPGENALCLIRPPGHHATGDRSMGFCIFNNIAVAAAHAIHEHQVNRILIVDWDVHHGNGTQDIFYDSDQVMFFSIHRHPFYPGSGTTEETGTGRGLGYTVNCPVTFGTQRQAYLDQFERHLTKAAEKIKPELVLISAGFDAHHQDPIGSLGLLSEDFLTMTEKVMAVAETHAGGRLVSFLEGGYNLTALGESVKFHLDGLLRRS